jgi:hypothetical protein
LSNLNFIQYLSEVERLRKGWKSLIFVFFKVVPDIKYFKGRRAHVFTCTAKSCKERGSSSRSIKQFVDKANAALTSNLRKHVKICWGDGVIKAADETKDVGVAHGIALKAALENGSMTAMFEQAKGKGVVTYSHTQHTKMETK